MSNKKPLAQYDGSLKELQSGDVLSGLGIVSAADVYFALDGEIKVASGSTDYIVPIRIRIPSGHSQSLVRCDYKLESGTSATVKLQKNGTDITGFTSMSVTTSWGSTVPTAVSLSDGDILALIVTAVSGTPKNMIVIPGINDTI